MHFPTQPIQELGAGMSTRLWTALHVGSPTSQTLLTSFHKMDALAWKILQTSYSKHNSDSNARRHTCSVPSPLCVWVAPFGAPLFTGQCRVLLSPALTDTFGASWPFNSTRVMLHNTLAVPHGFGQHIWTIKM